MDFQFSDARRRVDDKNALLRAPRWGARSFADAYDSAAREIKALAERGLVAVVDEQTSGDPGMLLTTSIRFRKLR